MTEEAASLRCLVFKPKRTTRVVFTLQLGLDLSLYLAASGLDFESSPCNISGLGLRVFTLQQWAWLWVFTLQHPGLNLSLYFAASGLGMRVVILQHLGSDLSLYLTASGLGFESLPWIITRAWRWVFTLQQHLGLALSLYLSSGLGFEQHLGLALCLYLAASGLGFESLPIIWAWLWAASGLGFESLPCSIWAWLWVFTYHLGLALSSIWAWLWVFTLQHLGLDLKERRRGRRSGMRW